MKEAQFIRKGKTITNVGDGTKKTFEFVNEAKRESRKLQMSADGALGRGSVQKG